MSSWSERDGADASAAPDATDEAARNGGGFCATSADATVFCDDFDTPPDASAPAWSDATVCDACVLRIVAPDSGAPPSPPNALYTESHAAGGNQQGPAHLVKTLDGDFSIATLSFAVYVDRADPTSQAAVQELAFEEETGPRIRARVWLSNGQARLETITSTPPPENVGEDVHVMPLSIGAWHRMVVTVSRAPTTGFVSFSVDGALVVDRHELAGGGRLRASFPRLVLRSGIRFLGFPPDPTGWRIFFDDVALSVP
jgi:hypothetical protein